MSKRRSPPPASQSPRVNVVVTVEQHALLLELSKLSKLSAAGFLRRLLDAATPMLRETVPALRHAHKNYDHADEVFLHEFEELMDRFKEVGTIDQFELLDHPPRAGRAAPRTERSEGGRGTSRRSGNG